MARRWLVAAVLLLAPGGCGDEPEAEPATVPVPAISSDAPASSPVIASGTTARRTAAADAARTTAVPDRVAPATVADVSRAGTAGFVELVRRELPVVAVDHREEEIAELARQSCASLAAGRSPGAVLGEVRAFGTEGASARKLVRMAVSAVCPEQTRRIDDL